MAVYYKKESDNYGHFAPQMMKMNPYQTQYADDYNQLRRIQQMQIEDWERRKMVEEDKWMKEKPRTYEYTAPYQEHNPPVDINKYFHDSRREEKKHEEKPDEYYYQERVPFETKTGDTTYEHTFISPRQRPQSQAAAGGYLFLRYHDSGHDDVSIALSMLQTTIKSLGGCIMGMAKAKSVFIVEGDGDWTYAREGKYNPRIAYPHKLADRGITVIWFPDLKGARGFNNNKHRNRFYERGFPTQHDYESVYVPAINPPVFKTADTYLLLEFINGRKYPEAAIKGFGDDLEREIYRIVGDCYPKQVSSLNDREDFKPGWIKGGSQVFVSRFHTQTDVAAVLNSRIIEELCIKHNLNGPKKIVSFSLKDRDDGHSRAY